MRADALVIMAEHARECSHHEAQPYCHCPGKVILHLDMNAQTQYLNTPGGYHDFHLHPDTFKCLSCDAEVILSYWQTKGDSGDSPEQFELLNIGRRSRVIPTALNQALKLRDQCCRFPGCGQKRFLHAHHIRHWAEGGETRLDNLILLCSRHHRLIHNEDYQVNIRNRHFIFTNPSGETISALMPNHKAYQDEPDRCTLNLEDKHKELNLPITPKTAVSSWEGDRLNGTEIEGLFPKNSKVE